MFLTLAIYYLYLQDMFMNDVVNKADTKSY